MRDSPGLGRLGSWATARVLFVVIAAGLGTWSLRVAIDQSHEVNPPVVAVNATVIRVHADNSDPEDKTLSVDVRFADKAGTTEQVTIAPDPYTFPPVSRGQKIPILYDEDKPSRAVYNAPNGDYGEDEGLFEAGMWEGPASLGAILWFGLAAILLLAGVWRLVGMMRAALAPLAVPVHLRTADGVVKADWADGVHALEWRVLPDQPELTGLVGILGGAAPGRWPVARLDTGRLVWPRSKAHPVPETAVQQLPEMGPEPLAPVYLLLAGYAQLFNLLDALPAIILRPPEEDARWWKIGALRAVVRALVTVRARRQLKALSTALLRSSLLCGESDARSRRSLAGAAEECRALADGLPQRSLIAAVTTITATALSIISPFLLLPHVDLTSGYLAGLLPILLPALVVCFGFLPLTIWFHSVQWKRALFSPPARVPARAGLPSAEHKSTWDVYTLERAAFAQAGLRAPGKGESPATMRRLVTAIYIVAAVIPFTAGFQVSAFPGGTLRERNVFPLLGIGLVVFCGRKVLQWRRRVRTTHAVPGPQAASPAAPAPAGQCRTGTGWPG